MEDSNLILEKISKILDLAKEVNDKDPGIGLVLNFCLKRSTLTTLLFKHFLKRLSSVI